MSSFLSNKYLRYREALRHGAPAIADDSVCGQCGYNLRGLQRGRNCPECGHAIPFDAHRGQPRLSIDPAKRPAMKWGLTMIATSVIAVVLVRLGFGVAWPASKGAVPLWPYVAASLLIALWWIAGVVLATPRQVNGRRRMLGVLRGFARWSQPLWIASLTCWLLAETKYQFTPPEDALRFWSTIAGVITKFGVLALGLVLWQAAEDLELEAARRIGLAIYVVPIVSAVLLLVPLRVSYIMLALMSPMLLAWSWYALQFGLGVWEIRQYVAWDIRLGIETGDREARIAETKAALDRQAQAIIRPLPAPPHAPPTAPRRRA